MVAVHLGGNDEEHDENYAKPPHNWRNGSAPACGESHGRVGKGPYGYAVDEVAGQQGNDERQSSRSAFFEI